MALVRAWILVGIFGASPVFSQPVTAPVLTNAAQIVQLSPTQAQAGLSVRIQGVVTCYDHGNFFFVQDKTAGVFVFYNGDRLSLRPGQPVQVTGSAGQGLYSPIIVSPTIQPVKSELTVVPIPVSMAQIEAGGFDAQSVEVSGVVRVQKTYNGRLMLEMADAPHRIQAWIVDSRGHENLPLVGSLVKIRGVAGSHFNKQKELDGFQIYANAVADIDILQKPLADPLSAPQCQVRDLKTYVGRNGAQGLVRVRGVVTFCQPGRAIFIQDSTGGLEVLTQASDDIAPGTTVEVAGYPGPILDSPLLEDAMIRKLETASAPLPVRALSADLFQGHYHNQLVEVKGLYLGRANMSSNTIALAMEVDDYHLTALLDTPHLPKTLGDLKPGSTIRVTGVCRSEAKFRDNSALSLLVRTPTDISIISAPAAATENSKLPVLTIATALIGIGLVMALGFIQKQRRRTKQVLQLQGVLQAEMRESEQQLRRSMEERERIGRDLHDDIIQSIYAAGFSLEDCRRLVHQSPEQTEVRLSAAISTLNKTIQNVRGFIAGLEPKVLNGGEFKTALKSLALTSGDSTAQFQFQVAPAAANSLNSAQATQLLHIAKEAMSNSLRHAHASSVTVSLQSANHGVRLEISDDGVGFDRDTISGTGQGLRNMAARAREIGGEIQTTSAPGKGCRILVTVPQRNAHEHD